MRHLWLTRFGVIRLNQLVRTFCNSKYRYYYGQHVLLVLQARLQQSFAIEKSLLLSHILQDDPSRNLPEISKVFVPKKRRRRSEGRQIVHTLTSSALARSAPTASCSERWAPSVSCRHSKSISSSCPPGRLCPTTAPLPTGSSCRRHPQPSPPLARGACSSGPFAYRES